MRNMLYSLRESYAAKTYTQMSTYLHMSHTDKNIIYIYTTSRVKGEWKYRVLHIIWRFYCVSGKAMFMTTDSNGPNSFTMSQVRTCSMNRKWQVFGFPKLRTASQFLSVSGGRYIAKRETAFWTSKLLGEADLVSAWGKQMIGLFVNWRKDCHFCHCGVMSINGCHMIHMTSFSPKADDCFLYFYKENNAVKHLDQNIFFEKNYSAEKFWK